MTALETLLQSFESIRDETRIGANTAERIGNAFLSLLSYLGNSPYIRKDQADVTQYLLKLLGGVSIGINGADNAVSGQDGKGIILGRNGDIETDKILVRGAAMFQELIVNKTQTLDGDTLFSASGIIDKVRLTDSLQYELTIRSMYDGDKTSLRVGDVCFTHLDNLTGDGSFRTSWFRVDAVDTKNNIITVTMFSESMCPGSVNYPPEAGSKVAQRGNVSDTDRQSVWYLSSTEKGLFFYVGVTKPIIDESNIYLFVGLPPKGLSALDGKPINYSHPYIYCRGLIVQDIIHIDYKGNPVYSVRDLGLWQKDVQYIRGLDGNQYYQDQTWHGGCCWRCATDKATVGLAPRFNNTEWLQITGSSDFFISLSCPDIFIRALDSFSTTITAQLFNAEMLISEDEIGKVNITWTRISVSGDGDAAWNNLHKPGSCGMSLSLTDADMPSDFLTARKVSFKISVAVADTGLYTQSYSISA